MLCPYSTCDFRSVVACFVRRCSTSAVADVELLRPVIGRVVGSDIGMISMSGASTFRHDRKDAPLPPAW